MTYTTYDTPASLLAGAPDALRRAAVAAGRGLPAEATVVAADPALVADGPALLGTPGAQAVAVSVTGVATGTVTLVVAEDVAAALRTGPLGADDLVQALTTPIGDAVAELAGVLGGPLEVGIADGVIAEAVDFAPEAVAVPLLDREDQLAVLVVELAAPEGPATAPAAHEPVAFTALVDEASAPVNRSLDLLHDVEMAVTVELGRTRMAVRDLLSLTPGAVVELDRAAGSPVDVLVNGKLIARGEVVVIDDDFGIRVCEIVGLQPERP